MTQNTATNSSSNTETNILFFPENKIVRGRPINKEQFNEEIIEHKIKYVDYILSKNMSSLFTKLGLEGINTETEQFYKDYSFTVETLRAALYRTMEMEHPIQDFVDENFQIQEETEESE